MNYKDEMVKAMRFLSQDDRVLFIGQSVRYPGHLMFNTLEDAGIPMNRRIELPVFEEVQLGMSIGLSLEGFIPMSIYPRMDFLIIAANQLVNHLDKIEKMSCGRFKPKVIMRTAVGSTIPFDSGLQHTQDHTEALRLLCPNIHIVKLVSAEIIFGSYKQALESNGSTILVEINDLYEAWKG